MTTVALLTANLGGFDRLVPPVEQALPFGVTLTTKVLTDENFPPRSRIMSPRLQARIPKMFGWQFVPNCDYYIWVDASFSMQHADSVAWFLHQCVNKDIALFLHPERHTVRAEYQYIKAKVDAGNWYLASRYAGEFLEEQVQAVLGDRLYQDTVLYASSAFVYRNCENIRRMLTEWWVHTSRYHAVDQLALPYVLWKNQSAVTPLRENLYKFPYLTFTRGQS